MVREGFTQGRIPGFQAYPDIQAEVKYGDNSRADLLLSGDSGRVFVEVKSVTLYRGSGLGQFPDAVSARGRKHLEALQSVLGPQTRAVQFFCVFHSAIEHVSVAADIDPHYRLALQEAMAAGVEVMAWKAQITPQGADLLKPLPFALDPPATS